MGEIALSGSLDWVQLRLVWLSQIIRSRKAEGWELFQEDELWLYESRGDDRVCPVCQGFEEQNPWKGNEVSHFFPHYEIVSARSEGAYVLPVIVHPKVHKMAEYSHLIGVCRCQITLLFPLETLEERLHLEIMEALVAQ